MSLVLTWRLSILEQRFCHFRLLGVFGTCVFLCPTLEFRCYCTPSPLAVGVIWALGGCVKTLRIILLRF